MKTLIQIICSVAALAGVADRNSPPVQFIKTNLILKTNLNVLQVRILCAAALGIGSFCCLAAATENSADTAPATTAIPWSQLGAKAGADYQSARIDRTFSDANWISMNPSIPGADGTVAAAVVDASGNR